MAWILDICVLMVVRKKRLSSDKERSLPVYAVHHFPSRAVSHETLAHVDFSALGFLFLLTFFVPVSVASPICQCTIHLEHGNVVRIGQGSHLFPRHSIFRVNKVLKSLVSIHATRELDWKATRKCDTFVAYVVHPRTMYYVVKMCCQKSDRHQGKRLRPWRSNRRTLNATTRIRYFRILPFR